MVFFENQYFFQSHVIFDAPTAPLPPFDDVPSFIKRFTPSIVYQKRPPLAPLPDTTPLPDSTLLVPRRCTRVPHAPDRYGFSHTSLTVTLDTVFAPSSYTQAATQVYWQ